MIECTQCDDYQAPNRDSLRSHANAKTDHEWSEIKQELEANEQGDDQEESETEQEDSSDDEGDGPDEQGDSSVEQGEASETSENDQQESNETEGKPMVSDQELRQQREQTSQTTSQNSQTATTATTSQPSQPSSQIPLPVPRSWLLALAALAALGLVVMWVRQGDQPIEPADIEPEPTDGESVEGRGLIE